MEFVSREFSCFELRCAPLIHFIQEIESNGVWVCV